MSEHAVVATIRKRLECFFPERTTPLVVACSGGSDSVALSIAVAQGGWGHAIIAHVDHGIQNEKDRQNETRTVEEVGAFTRLPVIHQVIPPGELQDRARHEGRSIEEVARNERYRLLAAVARSMDAPAVVSGHHRGDLVETVLFRLFSGRSVLEPLLIDEQRLLAREPGDIVLLRPALQLSRDSLEDFVRHCGAPIHTDPGNAFSGYRRNRVRNVLVPALNEAFPDRPAERAILSLARELRTIRDDVMAMVPAGIVLERTGERTVLHRAPFLSLPASVGELFLREIVYAMTSETRLSWKPIRLYLQNLQKKGCSTLTVQDIQFAATEERIVISTSLVPVRPRGYLLVVRKPGTVTILLDSQENKTIHSVHFSEEESSRATFPDAITLPLVVRSSRKKDSVQYRGRRHPLSAFGPEGTLAVLEDRNGVVAVLQGSTAFCVRDGIDCKTDAMTQAARELPLRFVCKEWKSYAEQ